MKYKYTQIKLENLAEPEVGELDSLDDFYKTPLFSTIGKLLKPSKVYRKETKTGYTYFCDVKDFENPIAIATVVEVTE